MRDDCNNNSSSNSSKNDEGEAIVWKDGRNISKSRIHTGVIINLKHVDLRKFLNDAKKIICEKLKSIIKNHGNIKMNFSLACKFSNVKQNETIEETKSFDTPNELFSSSSEMKKIMDDKMNSILLTKIEDFEGCGSGWTLLEIILLNVNINHFDPLLARSSTCVLLPDAIPCKKAGLKMSADCNNNSSSNSSKNGEEEAIVWKDEVNIFNSCIRTGVITNLKHLDLRKFINDAKKIICEKLKSIVKNLGNIKMNFSLACKFINVKEYETMEETKYFDTPNELFLFSSEMEKIMDDKMNSILLTKIEDFEGCGSGWTLFQVISLQVNIYHFDPLLAETSTSVLLPDAIEHEKAESSIDLKDPPLVNKSTFVPLPDFIQNKKAVLNIINEDRYSFFWSVIAALYPVTENSVRLKSYPHYSQVPQLTGIKCPTTLRGIPTFESKTNISINVYGLNDKKKIVPLYLSKCCKESHIDLFMVESNVEYDAKNNRIPTFHFCLIRDLSKLVRSQFSKCKKKHFLCNRCLNHFRIEESFIRHQNHCIKMNKTLISFPEKDEKIKFKNFQNKEQIPFVVYADLECILQSDCDQQKHIPYSVAFYVHCSYDNSRSQFRIKRDPNCIDWFILELKKLSDSVLNIIYTPKPMKRLTLQQKINYNNARECHICEESFSDSESKVRDHCHFTGNYRGAAHNNCNLNYKVLNIIPVVFHNLSGYDSHFLIKSLAKLFKGDIKLLPINKEKYISFTKSVDNDTNDKTKKKRKPERVMKLKFIDSFNFMSSSINTLASDLNNNAKLITKGFYKDPEKFELVVQKGIFPYEYIDIWDKLNETQLPEPSHFYSKLTNKDISNEDYKHALKVWNKFQIKTLGGYSDLYLKTDVLLLADIFENFRNNCFNAYGLDPLHYPTAPSLTFDAMLKYTKIELGFLHDVEMLNFIERGIRGGVSQCCNRYAKANNRYMGDGYDSNKDESFLMYFDVNNLYGVAMSEPLPTGSFEWAIDEFNIENIHNSIFNISNNSPIGYIFEVDLDYPKELHQEHKDLPLCPEHREPPGNKTTKLMTTLYRKSEYITHYRNLQQCIKLGLKITKIHRVLKFQQSAWLKKYIDLNTDKRKKSNNKFEENFFKLMNNAVYGKTMENVRNYKDIKFITKWEGRYGARNLIANPNFHNSLPLNDDMIIIEMKRLDILFNKPIYVGFAVLDLSKTYLYDFHYNYILKTFDYKSVKLMYTDTDSLIYHFININIYDYIKRDYNRFDTSNYPVDNVYGIPRVNKKVLGLMKDENNGIIMTEFIGLRAKLYSFKILGEKVSKKKAKGIKIASIENIITFDDYKKCLFDHKNFKVNEHHIMSQKHEVSTVQKTKIALSWEDDKRKLIEGTTDTLPWGYEQ